MTRHRRFLSALAAFLLCLPLLPVFRAAPAAATDTADAVWGAGYFPNVPLVTHEGKKVRFFDDLIKDKVVVINFIFTSCPDVCPLETARMREVQKILGDRVGQDVFIYSISIDPRTDTPEVLKRYAERFEAAPGWLFLTGGESDITEVRRKLGLYAEGEGALSQHSTSILIGNQKTGRWMKASPYENPYVLATRIGSWLHNWKMPSQEKRDYADAPELRSISKGESLFRTRCAACHTIGEDVAGSAKSELGPDLLGVTKTRDRVWLKRWLAAPDRMLAEKDPLALELLAAWNNVPMPNLRLNETEIEALLAFMEEESRRVEERRHRDHQGHEAHHDHGKHHDHGNHKHH
jgi:cytochrome oxidase Cu insertion factor (SCO1/SenC/PrrC family)/mono/diheme cytochrome c family protein